MNKNELLLKTNSTIELYENNLTSLKKEEIIQFLNFLIIQNKLTVRFKNKLGKLFMSHIFPFIEDLKEYFLFFDVLKSVGDEEFW